jgi:hypothetical protein
LLTSRFVGNIFSISKLVRGWWCEMGSFQNWKRECEEIEREMDRLITAGRPGSAEERQVRQLQFAALIERRDAASRSLLQADTAGRRHKPFGLSS